MDDDARIHWWRVASHLVRPGLILAVAGGVPSAALGAWLLWGRLDLILTVLAGFLLLLTAPPAFGGAVLLVFAAFAVAIGRVQWAIYTRRSLRNRRAIADASPYR